MTWFNVITVTMLLCEHAKIILKAPKLVSIITILVIIYTNCQVCKRF